MKIIESTNIESYKVGYDTNIFNGCVENGLYDEYELMKKGYDYILSIFERDAYGHWDINDFIERYKESSKEKDNTQKKEHNDLSNKLFILEVEYERMSDEKSALELEAERLKIEISNLKKSEFGLMLENQELKMRIKELPASINSTQTYEEEGCIKMKWNASKPKKILPFLLRELRNRGYVENTNEELASFLILHTDAFARVKESSIISNYLRGNSNDTNRNTDEIDVIICSTLSNT